MLAHLDRRDRAADVDAVLDDGVVRLQLLDRQFVADRDVRQRLDRKVLVLVHDPARQVLSGFHTFDDDHTGRREDETDTFSDGAWTAPSTPGLAHLWVVLRDSRGGTDWQSYVVDVQ